MDVTVPTNFRTPVSIDSNRLMKQMKCLLSLIVLLFTAACSSDDGVLNGESNPTSIDDYIIFGHFYGFCAGEECVEIFKLTPTSLSEDKKDGYPNWKEGYEGNFEKLDIKKFEAVNGLITGVPEALLAVQDTVLGCPDCTDGGGIYFEYKNGSDQRYWLIDQFQRDIPDDIYEVVEDVNNAIDVISN